MAGLCRELVFLIIQFLDEEKFKDTVHKLESESGYYFNLKYFEELVIKGQWDELEKYLAGFINLEDNRYSLKMLFEIRKQKYLEALDKKDHFRALEILNKELTVFKKFNDELFKEMTLLLTLNNFRENEQLSKYTDTKTARAVLVNELKKLIEANPRFEEKCQFPTFKNSRLRTLINQRNPKPNPEIKTLFADHSCGPANGPQAPSTVANQLTGSMPRVGGFLPVGAHVPFQPAQAPASHATSLGQWMGNPSPVPHQPNSGRPLSLVASNNADSEHVLKRSRPFGISEEGNNVPVNTSKATYPGQNHAHSLSCSDDLPKTVIAHLNQGSTVKSMDFHPLYQSMLLVGTNTGDIGIWEVGSRLRIALRSFTVWELGAHSTALQASLANDYAISVNRVLWSPDGALLGVAFSKNIVHVYAFRAGDELRNFREIDAHVGNVSDLAFATPHQSLCIITCGEDKTVKVWDVITGAIRHTFEGHDAPVYSLCPHYRENIQFLFSTGINGKIKAWLYDDGGSKVDYNAPGLSCTTMAYGADGSRLFSCGSSKDGESYLVEWDESEGAVTRTYLGLGKRSLGLVQFDVSRRYLAAGDDFSIKFWDMDSSNLLTSTIAEGSLPASPCVRFNKDGTLLAVSTSEKGIKVLGNAEGLQLVRSIENRGDVSRVASRPVTKASMITSSGASSSVVGTSLDLPDRSIPLTAVVVPNEDRVNSADVRPKNLDEVEFSKVWKLTEISEPSQLRSLKLPDNLLAVRIVRLKYTNSGNAILALACNAVHKVWKWQRSEPNSVRKVKATTGVPPQLWQPPSGILMTNDISGTNPEEAFPCIAVSKNDSYVMSSSGGKISLFNLMTFRTMTMFMAPPPAATALAFHPQDNNVIAIGMTDSSIHIYNVRVDKVMAKLNGHQKRVTGLAFSHALSILVSSGADAQLCVWKIDGWEKQASKFLQIPSGRATSSLAETKVQFQQDQSQFLVVHETHIAIYDALKLECLRQWVPREASGLITDATYSCNGQSIYVIMEDGSLSVLTSSHLRLNCRINPTAYLPSNSSSKVSPLVIAAHPTDPNQVALGLSDGGVCVLEPLESDKTWGTVPPNENGSGPSSTNSAAVSDPEHPIVIS